VPVAYLLMMNDGTRVYTCPEHGRMIFRRTDESGSSASEKAVADEQPFYSPVKKPPSARRREPGEVVFTFHRGPDQFLCELRDHDWSCEVQFFKNGEFMAGRLFRDREDALAWAQDERHAIVNGWMEW
jgi:hypothetical protein